MEIEQKVKNISILHRIHTAPLPETSVLMSDEAAVMNGFQPLSADVLFSWTTSSVVPLDPSWQSQYIWEKKKTTTRKLASVYSHCLISTPYNLSYVSPGP